MAIQEDQLPKRYRDKIDEQIDIYVEGPSITRKNKIPRSGDIPIDNPQVWLRIPDVICVFVDMLGSTRLSAEENERTTAGAYRLFTGTAVKLFSEFEAPYIDVRGDGVFALFDSTQPYRAIAAAVSFKTFAKEEFVPRMQEETDAEVGCHIGIDQKTVLVRKVGFRRSRDRDDRRNEVWAGKPVNMAAKLATMTEDNQLLVSDRYFASIQDDLVLKSCGCDGEGNPTEEGPTDLWEKIEDINEDNKFDFDAAHSLESIWCAVHGKQYCEDILALDDEDE